MKCDTCHGTGFPPSQGFWARLFSWLVQDLCEACNGTGTIRRPTLVRQQQDVTQPIFDIDLPRHTPPQLYLVRPPDMTLH